MYIYKKNANRKFSYDEKWIPEVKHFCSNVHDSCVIKIKKKKDSFRHKKETRCPKYINI